MPAPKRRPQSALMRQLIERPQQFQFFQAVRLIDLWLRRSVAASGQTLDRVLRFKNSVSLSFPPSQIEALSVDADAGVDTGTDPALQAALDQGQLRHIHITPAFMGFLGISGVLPYYYTDAIAAQIHYDKNEGGRAFLDMFSHRSMTLFYRAWEKCRIEYRLDANGKDGFLPLPLALAGIRPGPLHAIAARDPGDILAEEVVAHYAALIRHRPVSADMMVGVLNEYFGLPFRLEQFVGAGETLRPDERSRVGVVNRHLGVNAILGQRYRRRDLCVRLWIGPLGRAEFDHFLPGAGGGKALKALLALFAVPTIRFEVRLILRAADVASVKLDRNSRLGRGSFVTTKPAAVDQDKTRYYIRF